MSAPLLEFRNVSIARGEKLGLDSINLSGESSLASGADATRGRRRAR